MKKKPSTTKKKSGKPEQMDFTVEPTISYTISRLPVSLHKKIRLMAAEKNTTNIEIIVEAIRQYFEGKPE